MMRDVSTVSLRDRRVIVALLRYHVSLQVSVRTRFLKARLSQDTVCRVVCGRLVEVTLGPPTTFPVRARVYRCPCRDLTMCHRVQGDSVAKRQPLLCVCWSRDVVCALRSCSWSCITHCATENAYTFGTGTLPFSFLPFSSRQRWSPFARCLRSPSPPSFDTATFYVGARAVGMRICSTHDIAGSTGRAELWSQILQLRQQECLGFSSSNV